MESGRTYTADIVPRATYRLQLNKDFGFAQVKEILSYLAGLGISHLYLSPIFKARPGSMHGYDVVDHSTLNPELGSRAAFSELASSARAQGMGIILDIVPNHMAVHCDENAWWRDVLEHGPAARSARCFDIDWRPLRASMRDRILVPMLERPFGEELRTGRIQLGFVAERGEFVVTYASNVLPVDPRQYAKVLVIVAAKDPSMRVDSMVKESESLPAREDSRPSEVERRYVDAHRLKTELADRCRQQPLLAQRIHAAVSMFNDSEQPEALDRLADLLESQPYRLAYWKVAGHEINYRRFFDVNQLAALRVCEPKVFTATHSLVLELLRNREIDGLRIDHIDGLSDPLGYLQTLQEATSAAAGMRCYVVAEKILAAHERLREEWPMAGTTGYDFGASVCAWFSFPKGVRQLEQTYRSFIRQAIDYAGLVAECKKLLMTTSLAAEISVLAVQLDRIAQMHRETVDFTHLALRDALIEVIAAFPVYRTYVSEQTGSDDQRSIDWAIGVARSGNATSERSTFDFIHAVLTKKIAPGDDARRHAVDHFVERFQQVTPAVTAKALEDTVFYRYCRLLTVNDVGSDPRTTGISTASLQKLLAERGLRWPHAMLGTSTHDSKRGEDVRYRLAVLSELPYLWRQFAVKASQLNRGSRTKLGEQRVPSRNDEYLLLQSILGIWPWEAPGADLAEPPAGTLTRLREYTIKALREAKQHTSWIEPNSEYEAACLKFLDGLFAPARLPMLSSLLRSVLDTIAYFGLMNSLSACVLKSSTPGVPDFYQGSECIELSLVDPDNRRPVNFDLRALILAEVVDSSTPALTMRPTSDNRMWASRLKFRLIRQLLEVRRTHVEMFSDGSFVPLTVSGAASDHVCAFLRQSGQETLVVVTTRWLAALCKGDPGLLTAERWQDTAVELPPGLVRYGWHNVLAQKRTPVQLSIDSKILLRDLLVDLPVAVLVSKRETETR